MSEELPEGWASATPDDLSQDTRHSLAIGPFGSSLKVSDYTEAGVPLVFVRDIRAERFGGSGTRHVTAAKARDLAAHTVGPGDLLVTKMGEPPGDTAIYPSDTPAAIITADCIKLSPNQMATSARFLKHCLRAPSVRRQIAQRAMGVAQQKLSLERFRTIHLPLPPVAEQDRIVEAVEALLAQVKVTRERLANVPLIVRRFRQSVLASACSGKLIEAASEEWPGTSVGDLLIDAKYGTSDRCGERSRGSVPVLRVPNIASGKLDLTSLKFAVPQRTWASLMLKDGDVLICRTNGSLDLIGKAAVVADLSEPAAFASYLIRLRTNTQALLPRFLHLFLLSPSGRDQITAEARTTAGQFNLNLEILRGLRFMLPPLEAQAKIVRRVDALFALAATIERRVAVASARAGALTQAIIAKAFRGELVPTEAELARAEGRDYESAESLLTRIQLERTASVPTPGARRGAARRARSEP